MLANKFIEFLKKVGCNYCKNYIPNRNRGRVARISVNGDISRDELEEFLVDIYTEGYDARRDDEDRKKKHF